MPLRNSSRRTADTRDNKPNRRFLCLLLVSTFIASGLSMGGGSAQAVGPPRRDYDGPGFDTCSAPDTATMDDWWTSSPYDYIGIYVYGALKGCAQPQLGSGGPSWVDHNRATGWGFIMFDIDAQPPCSGFRTTFSYDPGTAFNQGVQSASAADAQASRLGWSSTIDIIYYDLEPYDTRNQACKDATRAFIDGYDARLHQLGDAGGVYGNETSQALSYFAGGSSVPVAVAIPYYDGNPDVFATDVPSALWGSHQRIKQYDNTHNESWGSHTLSIDRECAHGQVMAAVSYNDPCRPG